MPNDETSICLSMIVKNEAHVIERCLASVRDVIRYWVIVDTGSVDGTQDKIRQAMADIPGELHERPWIDFAFNRSEALRLARDKAEYTVIIDADDVLERESCGHFQHLDFDAYFVRIVDTSITYPRLQLVSNAHLWRYVGVLHEFLDCEGPTRRTLLEGVTIRRNHDGARRRDPGTYYRDAELLERAIRQEPNDWLRARYIFYLAQSYRDCGAREKSLCNYLKRADLGHWTEEVYVSLCEAGHLHDALAHSESDVLTTFGRAITLIPNRAEAYHAASRYLRRKNRFVEGYAIARQAVSLRPSVDGLFVHEWTYDIGILDEYAVCAFWAGHHHKCVAACLRLLQNQMLDDATKVRVEANLAAARLGPPPPAIAPPEPTPAYPISRWQPDQPQGGTELMRDGLLSRLGPELSLLDLHINSFNPIALTGRPLLLWMHHDIDQQWVQWCNDPEMVRQVARFVFVSYWQCQRYVSKFDLPAAKCVVIRNAVVVEGEIRPWPQRRRRRVAYTSTPFRGLAVLLEAWSRLQPENAELHVWSSSNLYGPHAESRNDRNLVARTAAIPGVHYRGLLPNVELRAELQDVDILAYPSIFAETSCLAVIEAMAAGCRVLCAAHGALPETTAGFARLYSAPVDPARHAELLAGLLRAELEHPWEGDDHMARDEQIYVRTMYDWSVRVRDWRRLVAELTS